MKTHPVIRQVKRIMATYLREYGLGSPQNERKTLKKTVRIRDIIPFISSIQVRTTLERHLNTDRVNLWDLGANASEFVETNDSLYLRCEERLYSSRILEKIFDQNGEIGKSDVVNWHEIHHAPWQHPLLLVELRPVSIPPLSLMNRFKQRKLLAENFWLIPD